MAKKEEEKLLGSSLLGVQDNTARQLANYQAGYKEGERVQNAYNDYNTLKQNAPQAYVSPYQQQLDDIYNKIVNRPQFKYDLRGDMLYQNAKEQYQQLGKQAMVDTMGQAAQLTGGYGNSYAQNVGNQAYQQYLLKLNDLIPEYAKLAQDRYNMEGDALNTQYSLARDRENDAYNKYRDTVSDYNQNLQLAYNVYGQERDNDYSQYRDALNYWQNQAGAENDDYWKQAQFDYQKAQDERELAYKYASLAQSKALAEAKLKAQQEEEAKRKAEEDAAKQSALSGISRFVSNGLGLNNIGLGVRLSVEDAIAANEAKNSTNPLSPVAPRNLTVFNEKNADMNKLKLGNVSTSADIVKAANEKRKSYTSDAEFKADLADTLEYMFDNKLIDYAIANEVLKKFK